MRVGTVQAVGTCRGTTAYGLKAGEGWGAQERRSSGVQENARSESDSGRRRTWGAEEMETNGVPRRQGGAGCTRLMRAPA